MNESRKYCRSLHAQISLGTTSDDRFMPNNYVKSFAEMDNLVLTEKLDGQNNCFNKYGVFARSHTAVSAHPWDKPLRERWELIKNDLNDLEIFGENMYGIHSIAYKNLESYFYVFAVRDGDTWLSWEEV
ncbi:MAG: RNA ligase family protein, partial [Chitinophagales bacterium]